MEFAKYNMAYNWKFRKENKTLYINKDHIKSGTLLLLVRFDGNNELLHYLSGSKAVHAAMTLWDRKENELYVIESTSELNGRSGIMKTKWYEFIKVHEDYSYNAVMLQLNEEK